MGQTEYVKSPSAVPHNSGVRRHSNRGHRGLTGLICMAKKQKNGEIIKSGGGGGMAPALMPMPHKPQLQHGDLIPLSVYTFVKCPIVGSMPQ